MNKLYSNLVLPVACIASLTSTAQPCTGTPAGNTVIAQSYSVCTGSSASLSLAYTYTSTGINYQWQSSTVSAVGPFMSIPGATLSNYVSGPLNMTTYYNVLITCTNSAQNTSASQMISVTNCSSNCVANAGFSLVPTNTPQVWNAIPASTASVAAAMWQWGDGATSNTLFTSHQYSAAGMYTICLSVTLTCGSQTTSCSSYSVYRSSSAMVQVNVVAPGTVGLPEKSLSSENVVVYPNPNNGHFTVSIPDNQEKTCMVEVLNLVGQLVYTCNEKTDGPVTRTIDLSHLPNGSYFVRVSLETGSVITKITIQK